MDQSLPDNEDSRVALTPRLFVAVVWAAMSVAALWLAMRFGNTSPYSDELRWLDVVAGKRPADAAWLVQLENLHCAPAVKLAYLASVWLSGDFRGPAVLGAVLLSAAAAVLLIAVARLRGRTEPLDALIPVMLLNFGHGINLVWGLQICYVLPVALACFMLAMLARNRERLSPAAAALIALLAATAALCGGPGVFYLPPLCAWLVYGGWRWRKDSRVKAAVAIALAGAAALPLVFYLPALRQVAHNGGGGGGLLSLPRGTLEFFSSALGKIGVETHPLSGCLVIAALVAAFVILWRTWQADSTKRLQSTGLAALLGGGALMALGTAAARAEIGCLQVRYALLSAPMLLSLYLVAVIYGPPLRRPFIQPVLALIVLVVAILYHVKGYYLAEVFSWNIRRFETAAAEGFSPQALAVRYAEDMQAVSEQAMLDSLATMKAARLGPYRPGRQIAPPRDDAIVALHPPGNPFVRSPCRMETLAAGKVYVQTIRISPLSQRERGLFALHRIDVKIGGRGRRKAAMHWAIAELAADGSRRRRAEGWISPAEQTEPDYISLRFQPFSPAADSRLELQLCDQCEAGFRLRLPLYQYSAGRSGVFGFLYFARR
jgi:hypothetical protein